MVAWQSHQGPSLFSFLCPFILCGSHISSINSQHLLWNPLSSPRDREACPRDLPALTTSKGERPACPPQKHAGDKVSFHRDVAAWGTEDAWTKLRPHQEKGMGHEVISKKPHGDIMGRWIQANSPSEHTGRNYVMCKLSNDRACPPFEAIGSYLS